MRPNIISLCALIQEFIPNATRGAEIGVWKGETSAAVLKEFPNLHLLCVDVWKEWKPGSVYYDKHRDMGRYTQAEWDVIHTEAINNLKASGGKFSIRYQLSDRWIGDIPNGSLDFVFLDANHMYQEIKADIQNWAPKVKSGGLVMGHDINGIWDRKGIWGITKATHEIFGSEKVMTRRGHVWAVVKE